jgi:16S rRNA (guanine527-N7)-methyltransferase
MAADPQSRVAFGDGEIWTRHVADSLQLVDHAPEAREWVDLGTGGGFPGLVIAIALKENRRTRFTLVESNGKKAAFLRAAVRATGANAVVAAERIEEHGAKMAGQAQIVSARALAPLKTLCRLAAPYLRPDGLLLLLKGQDFPSEHAEALTIYDYRCERFPSATDPEGSVVAIRELTRKKGGL